MGLLWLPKREDEMGEKTRRNIERRCRGCWRCWSSKDVHDMARLEWSMESLIGMKVEHPEMLISSTTLELADYDEDEFAEAIRNILWRTHTIQTCRQIYLMKMDSSIKI